MEQLLVHQIAQTAHFVRHGLAAHDEVRSHPLIAALYGQCVQVGENSAGIQVDLVLQVAVSELIG
jgi:hypothetical protein